MYVAISESEFGGDHGGSPLLSLFGLSLLDEENSRNREALINHTIIQGYRDANSIK